VHVLKKTFNVQNDLTSTLFRLLYPQKRAKDADPFSRTTRRELPADETPKSDCLKFLPVQGRKLHPKPIPLGLAPSVPRQPLGPKLKNDHERK
jgi:hypothetical protein